MDELESAGRDIASDAVTERGAAQETDRANVDLVNLRLGQIERERTDGAEDCGKRLQGANKVGGSYLRA
jgi:hypothetical protein